jgi:hypothetical protein
MIKWSLIWLGSKTWLEQLVDGLKWLSGNGETGRSDNKDEFYVGALPCIEDMRLRQAPRLNMLI